MVDQSGYTWSFHCKLNTQYRIVSYRTLRLAYESVDRCEVIVCVSRVCEVCDVTWRVSVRSVKSRDVCLWSVWCHVTCVCEVREVTWRVSVRCVMSRDSCNFSCFTCHQIDDYGLVRFLPLDISDEESINDILLQIDLAIQYGEDQEPREPHVRSASYLLIF